MVHKIIIEDRTIELPNDYLLDERIKFCEEVIEKNLQYFTYEIPTVRTTMSSASEKVKLRLSIMGEYIYDGSTEGKDDTVVTQWRKRRNTNREIIFSELERNNDE